MGAPLQVPPNAVLFSLWRLHPASGKSEKTGQRWKNWRRERVRGAPDENGVVVDLWPVGELDTSAIVDAFGPGRYRVAFHAADGNVGKEVGKGCEFELTKPPKRSGRLGRSEAAAAPAPTTEREILAAAASGKQIGVVELIALMDAQRERAETAARVSAETARAEAASRQASDREFFAMILNRTPMPGAAPAPAGPSPVDFAREMALLRRELRADLRDEAQRMRAELDELEEPEGPETAGDALNLAGVEAVSALGEVAPGLVQDAVSGVRAFLRAKGQAADSATIAKLAGAVKAVMQAEANGAGDAADA